MIPIKLKKARFKYVTYFLPTSYEDMKLRHLVDYDKHVHDPNELISFLADIPHKVEASELYPFLRFLSEPIDVDTFSEDLDCIDLKREAWGKKVEAHQLLMQDQSLRNIGTLIEIYYPDFDALNKSLGEVIPLYKAILKQIKEILEVEKHNLDNPPSAEQIRAGIEEFSKLGYFNTIDDLAGGDPIKYDAVLELEYIVIYNKLLKSKISSKFAERYSAILREKK